MGVALGLMLLLVAAASRGDASLLQKPVIELIKWVLLFVAAGVGLELFLRLLLPPPKD